MIGSAVERTGIIRHSAKMVAAISDAVVPKISVVLRKAYGAGLYAMCGPAFDADATLALPQASIAVMGAEAAVNAVYANRIAAKSEAERAAYVEELRRAYGEDVDIVKLASDLHIDLVSGDDLRANLIRRFATMTAKIDHGYPRRRPVLPAYARNHPARRSSTIRPVGLGSRRVLLLTYRGVWAIRGEWVSPKCRRREVAQTLRGAWFSLRSQVPFGSWWRCSACTCASSFCRTSRCWRMWQT
jgi:hypothetical protein